MFNFQLKLLFGRKEFYYTFLGVTIYSIVALIFNCVLFYGEEFSNLLPANQLMLIFNDSKLTTIFVMLLPLIIAIPFADTYFTERQSHTLSAIVSRGNSIKNYYFSKITVVFLSAILIVLIPLLINFALTLIAFPTETIRSVGGHSTAGNYIFEKSMGKYILFFNLFLKHPYIYNLLFCFMISIFSGFGAVLTYEISFWIKRTRILVIGVFFIISELAMYFSEFIVNFFGFDIYYYQYLTAYNQIISINIYVSFFIVMLIFLVIIAMLIPFNLKKLRDMI